MSAMASPWLPALQALARRRVALSPRLDAEREEQRRAAVTIQSRMRGQSARRDLQMKREDLDAEKLILAAMKASDLVKVIICFEIFMALIVAECKQRIRRHSHVVKQ